MVKGDRKSFWCPSTGLCTILTHLYAGHQITYKEYLKAKGTLKRYKPKGNPSFYMGHWFPRDGKERGEFLDMLIKKYSYKAKRKNRKNEKKIFLR